MEREYHQKKIKKYESSLVFSDHINRLWRLLKDKSKLLSLCCSIHLISNDLSNISCVELISSNFYKSVSYLILLLNNTTINFKFILYPNTSDNSTLLFLELSTFFKEQNENLEEIPKEFLLSLSMYLKNTSIFLYEYESILLNCDIVPIWNYIINETNFEEVLAQSSNYIKKVGDTFMYKIYENDVKVAKVTKIERDCAKKQCTLCFDLFSSKEEGNVECEVSFFLLITKENNTFLSYHHDFKSPIEQSELNILAKKKKKFLNEIKTMFEKKKILIVFTFL